jgi:Ca2+-binding RTX toxin-like protein
MPIYRNALKPFVLDSTDMTFLLDQVSFRPLFDVAGNAIIGWNGVGAIYDAHQQLIWNGTGLAPADAIALYGTSYYSSVDLAGLRDPSGNNNNLLLANAKWGAVDQHFGRIAQADYAHYVTIDRAGATGAFAANETYYGKYSDGSATDGTLTGQFGVSSKINTNYAITTGGTTNAVATDGTPISIQNVVDYTPRMISLLTTTAGVTYDTWANHQADPAAANHAASEIYYDADGIATVTDWGDLKTVADGGLGQVDTQARLAASAGQDDHFIGGLNPGVSPSNGFFVLFGQFFDHGLDFIGKGSAQTIKIALATDDPLYGMKGSDGQPVHEITITRATVDSVDANGNPQYINHTSPYIDQSQTYGSHEQLTNLLREWVPDQTTATPNDYRAGMKLFDGHTLSTSWTTADGTVTNQTLPTLDELRAHVVATGRDALTWDDVLDYRNRDAHGHVTSGTSGSALLLDMNPRFDAQHLHGFYDTNANGVLDSGERSYGTLGQATLVDTAIAYLNNAANGGIRSGDSFGIVNGALTLTLGSALSAGPGNTIPAGTVLTGASALSLWVNFSDFSILSSVPAAVHDAVSQILLASVGDHYVAGDGRVNENFGLTSIHHIFHEEHNFQVQNVIDELHRADQISGDPTHATLHGFQIDTTAIGGSIDKTTGDFLFADGSIAWDQDKVFNASKLIVEMEYQHAAVDQYARNVSPNIQEFGAYSTAVNSEISLEYSQTAFRFGHSTLRETIDTIDPTHGLTGKIMGYALHDAFLSPEKFSDVGPAAILLGMSHQQMNEVDEFVTPALNQGLLGQPLDLAAINIARGRDLGIPTLNDFREALGMVRYSSWTDFGQNMQHPSSLVNFIAAYAFDGDLNKANAIVGLVSGTIAEGADAAMGISLAKASAFMSGDVAVGGDGTLAFNAIDTWLGGLAEVHQPGGLLGETFDKVFVDQIEQLMDGDRFYYLYRTFGTQFGNEIANGQLKDIVERNSGLTHLNGNIFGYADEYVDLSAHKEVAATPGAELQTTGNDHKYGDVYDTNGVKVADGALTLNPTLGIYSNGGLGNANDGHVVTIGGVQYIQDTRLADSAATQLNDGVNLDGTPNSGAESSEVIVGTDRADLIYAQGGDDTVYGDAGNDKIYGGYGIDRLYGGDGNDTIYGGDNPDLIDGGSGDDMLYGESSGSDINGQDQVIGGSGNDYVSGGTGIDKLLGGTGDDYIDGGQDTDPNTHGDDGNDIIDGGSGTDVLYGDNGDDLIMDGADVDISFGGNGDDIMRVGDIAQALGAGPDEVLGGDGITDEGNTPGSVGFDIMDFSLQQIRAEGVTYDLDQQQNPLTAINGQQTVPAAFQIEGLIGSAGNDTLSGDGGNNWIIGGAGNDTLDGDVGNDVIVGGSIRLDALIGKYESAPGVLSTYDHNNNNAGITAADQLQDAQYDGASHRVGYTDTLATSGTNAGIIDAANAQLGGVDYDKHFTEMLRSAQFKDLVLGDAAGTTLTGQSDTLVLQGTRDDYVVQEVVFAGHKVLRITGATTGSDLVVDVNTFRFVNGTTSTTYSFEQMVQPRLSVSDVFVGEGLNGTHPMTFTITLSSKSNSDVTVSYAFANGTATAGSDYTATPGTLTFKAGEITKTVTVNVLGDAVQEGNETLTLTLSNPVNAEIAHGVAVGTILNDDLVGTPGANVLTAPNLGVTNGITLDYYISGLGGNDTLTGGNGNDLLDGGTGNDTMSGGLGSDTYIVAQSGDIVIEAAGDLNSIDTVQASIATYALTVNVENLVYTGTQNFTGTGNDLANVITGAGGNDRLSGGAGNDTLNGGAGNDTLDGGTGNDTMVGGTGNDTYVVDSAGDVVTEASNEGTDIVNTTLAAYTLTANVENLTFTGTGDFAGTGNDLANVINGGGGNDTLLGGAGDDTLNGGAGNDTLKGGAGNDALTGGAGNDTLDGGTGNDTMVGGAGNDTYLVDSLNDRITESNNGGTDTVITTLASYTLANNLENLTYSGTAAFVGTGNGADNILTGGDGNDTLIGLGGADQLLGGAGADVFVFKATSDSSVANPDTILDFTTGLDKIDLFAIDANTRSGGNQAFTFIGSNAFTGSALMTNAQQALHAGELHVDIVTGVLSGDVNGDGIADFSILLTNAGQLQAADFVL